jgi:signal transduction histidine kinase
VGRRLRISVIDDGPGLSDERVAQIFGSFGHVASSGVEGSMGLGLNVSRMLADLIGSKLVHERIGGETHFSIDLDLGDASDAATSST